jgi:hypothetical protein
MAAVRWQTWACSHAILTDSDNQLLEYIAMAKDVLQASTDQRLARVEQIQKSSTPEFLEALLIIAKPGRAQSSTKNAHSQTKKWQSVTKSVLDAQSNLQYNPNQKLLLTNLMLEL